MAAAGGAVRGACACGRRRRSWLVWLTGLALPLALIWLAVWSARSLSLLRDEAAELRAVLEQMQGQAAQDQPAQARCPPAMAAEPRTLQRAAGAGRAPAARPGGDGRQASLQLDLPAAPELTAPELFFALNFPTALTTAR